MTLKGKNVIVDLAHSSLTEFTAREDTGTIRRTHNLVLVAHQYAEPPWHPVMPIR